MDKDLFQLVAPFGPCGDQPRAIEELVAGVKGGNRYQTLLGATGTGKTFTMAATVAKLNRPTLIIAHNKTLAAQLCGELRAFFPHNAVEYFVSYYDYYQPEAYVPATDTYIEKDSAINDEIDKMRHSATSSLLERRDVIVVSSVSCIYNLGSPDAYKDHLLSLRVGMERDRSCVLRRLISMQYSRNEIEFMRGSFRVRGDVLEIFPVGRSEHAVRVEFFGDVIERIREIDITTGEVTAERDHVAVFPASHYVTGEDSLRAATITIREELRERLRILRDQELLVEAQRLQERTSYDLEMLMQMGFCKGIENYSRHLVGFTPGTPPYTLLDYFPNDYLVFIDESHVTVPQIRGMFHGDQMRKEVLVKYGFRLPSAKDNRPLNFDEFEERFSQVIFVSATPGSYELEKSPTVVEQIIRPTGLLDPLVHIQPSEGQMDHLLAEIRRRVGKKERVLVATLTKRMAEDLTDYFKAAGVMVRYMHADVKTIDRMHILRDLRLGVFDVLVGINLLREGLDLPEVSLVAILDADREGFLRTDRTLIQMIGRAARNENGEVILYADKITSAMRIAMEETQRRRVIQNEYNVKHKITPKTVEKAVPPVVEAAKALSGANRFTKRTLLSAGEKKEQIASLEREMQEASRKHAFERAAELRDCILELKAEGSQ
ncbi:excinuclease ABC subunit UvrB [Pasteuria penetrans]|uniref:excinuclease ABC subunit UvrB n=1 Tax=Pasteuria penetrans TaxID=86005 RepID=UPI0011ECE8E4|nr:excinuclease ABC subunit UvrB [Pasteuria penetrans]